MTRLTQEGDEKFNKQISSWATTVKTTMNGLLSYHLMQNTVLNQSALASKDSWMSQNQYFNQQIQLEQYQARIIEGYRVLNQIGEAIRGTEITYTLILNNDGSHVEWSGLNMKQFLPLVSVTPTGNINLRSDTVINELLKSSNGSQNIKYSKWTKEKEQAYLNFKDIIQNSGKWKKLNEGQQLEAFSKYYRYKNKTDDSALKAMSETLSFPEAFWQDGDDQIGKGKDKRVIQYKGAGASVTNVDTLIAKLEKVYSALMEIQNQSYNHAPYADNQGLVQRAESNMNNSIKKLIVQFINNDVLKALNVKAT